MPKVRRVMSMGFVANFIRFPAVKNFENRLRFDKVTQTLKVGTFLRHSVATNLTQNEKTKGKTQGTRSVT